MILEQIDFVDVQKTAIRLCKQARFKRLFTRAQRSFEIKRTDHSILGRTKRQVNKRHCHLLAIVRAIITAAPRPCAARAAISNPSVGAAPHSAEAAVNRTMPANNKRRRSMMSPSRTSP